MWQAIFVRLFGGNCAQSYPQLCITVGELFGTIATVAFRVALAAVSVSDECFWRADKPFWTTRDAVVCITAIHIMWKTVWINQAVQSNTGAHGWFLWSSSFFSMDCHFFV